MRQAEMRCESCDAVTIYSLITFMTCDNYDVNGMTEVFLKLGIFAFQKF